MRTDTTVAETYINHNSTTPLASASIDDSGVKNTYQQNQYIQNLRTDTSTVEDSASVVNTPLNLIEQNSSGVNGAGNEAAESEENIFQMIQTFNTSVKKFEEDSFLDDKVCVLVSTLMNLPSHLRGFGLQKFFATCDKYMK